MAIVGGVKIVGGVLYHSDLFVPDFELCLINTLANILVDIVGGVTIVGGVLYILMHSTKFVPDL